MTETMKRFERSKRNRAAHGLLRVSFELRHVHEELQGSDLFRGDRMEVARAVDIVENTLARLRAMDDPA